MKSAQWSHVELHFLFPGEMKEFGSRLEVAGRKERTQSLSNIDILISPCDSNLRSPWTHPGSSQTHIDFIVDKVAEKTGLETAVSFPLWRSTSPTLSPSPLHRKSISSIFYTPTHYHQEGTTTGIPFRVSNMPDSGAQPSAADSESKQEEERTSSGTDSGVSHGSGEELQMGEDWMYPTLRSKSLNANPRKIKKTEGDETLRTTGSVNDLVATFSGTTGGLRARTKSRNTDWGTSRTMSRDCGNPVMFLWTDSCDTRRR